MQKPRFIVCADSGPIAESARPQELLGLLRNQRWRGGFDLALTNR